MSARPRRGRFSFSVLPLYLWTVCMVLFPMGYVLVLSFLTRGEAFGVIGEVTLANYARIFSQLYGDVFGSSLRVALSSTLFTLAVAYPFAYIMARKPKRVRSILMLLVIIPFWTSALMRTYGWMILLRNRGLVNGAMLALGLIDRPLKLLNTQGAVLVGMAYSMLPFMILPIYNSVEKLDWSLLDAARDLGAGPARAFFTVTLPLTLPGVLSGCVLVFVPSMGMFFISDLLGGGTGMLLGNLIHNQLTVSRDWPFGAALSMIMVVLTFLVMGAWRRVTGGELGVL